MPHFVQQSGFITSVRIKRPACLNPLTSPHGLVDLSDLNYRHLKKKLKVKEIIEYHVQKREKIDVIPLAYSFIPPSWTRSWRTLLCSELLSPSVSKMEVIFVTPWMAIWWLLCLPPYFSSLFPMWNHEVSICAPRCHMNKWDPDLASRRVLAPTPAPTSFVSLDYFFLSLSQKGWTNHTGSAALSYLRRQLASNHTAKRNISPVRS